MQGGQFSLKCDVIMCSPDLAKVLLISKESVCDLNSKLAVHQILSKNMALDELLRFLVELPSELGYNNPLGIRRNVYNALYYAATNNGKYLDSLFPHINTSVLDELRDLGYTVDRMESDKPFYDVKRKRADYSHPKDKVCARQIRNGEPDYRCEQCCFDETCILCVHCFNRTDHVGHNVSMHIAKSTGGSFCDCGDPEAFNVELNCQCSKSPSEKNFDGFSEALRETIKVCLDYILDVTNFSVHTLPFVHNNLDKKGSPLNTKDLSNHSNLRGAKYGDGIDVNSNDLWYLILWNDEHHGYPQAELAVRAATGYSNKESQRIARHINSYGRYVLREATNYQHLQRYKELAEADGLVTTIQSARDYTRELIVKHLFYWLNEITNFAGDLEFAELSKSYLVVLLLEPNFTFNKMFPTEFVSGISISDKRRCFENGILFDGNIVNMGLTSIDKKLDMKELLRPVHLILEPNPKLDKLYNSRLQFLLFFQHRFVSIIRKRLSTLLFTPIVADQEKKVLACKQIIEIYPSLITNLALADREDDLNLLHEISAQLLSCPLCVSTILQSNFAGNIIGPVTQIIEEHSAKWNFDTGYPNFVEIATKNTPPQTYVSRKKAVLRGIHDIMQLVNKPLKEVSVFLKRDTLLMLLTFFRNFQGFWSIERKYGDHVEQDYFDNVHMEYSATVLTIAKLIATAELHQDNLIQSAISTVWEYLNLRKIKMHGPGIADFRVSVEPTSFISPINSFLSFLAEKNNFKFIEHQAKITALPVMNFSDISLRSIVLANQVKIGLWIRNGFNVSGQATIYLKWLRDGAFHRDFHLNQLAAIFDDPRTTFYNFLDRWELFKWFMNDVDHTRTIYEERFSSICDKFVVFLYNLIANRIAFATMTAEEVKAHNLKNSLYYSLCDEPKPYSQLKHQAKIEFSDIKGFDECLKECADFQPPTGLVDSGLYRLKPEIYQKLDPLSIYLDSSQFQSVTDSLAKSISQNLGLAEGEVVITPHIFESDIPLVNERLGDFAKTKDFSKFLYKLLQIAIDDSDETYLPQLLHLLHVILIDDEKKNGNDYLCENFVIIPISDLLVTIVESKMSKHVVKKADHLVELMMLKDSRVIESLMGCFGEEYVQLFKKRKVGLFESDLEKKKRLAAERASKIMKKFVAKRLKFLKNNKDLDFDSEPVHKEVFLRTCVMCGEPESVNDTIGYLASKTVTSTLWKLPEHSLNLSIKAFQPLDVQKKFSGERYGEGYVNFGQASSWDNNCIDAPVMSTCGHHIHFSCYQSAHKYSIYLPCPLCHILHDTFIPSFISPAKPVVSESVWNNIPLNNKYNQIITSPATEKHSSLLKLIVSKDYFVQEESLAKLPENIMLSLFSRMKNKKYHVKVNADDEIFNRMQSLSILIADTIRMNEISTRLEGAKSFSNFLLQIPDHTKIMIRSLIQCNALTSSHLKTSVNGNDNFKYQLQSFWDSNFLLDGVFNMIVVLFFQTDESFLTLAYLGLCKLFTIAVFSLLQRCKVDSTFVMSLFLSTDEIDQKVMESFSSLVKVFYLAGDIASDLSSEPLFLRNLYHSVERILQLYLKQIILLADILTGETDSEGSWISGDQFLSLNENNPLTETTATKCYTNCLGIPSLEEMIENLNSDTFPLVETILKTRSNESYPLTVHETEQKRPHRQIAERKRITEFELVRNVFENVLFSKIPKFDHLGILTLEYPGIIKLIDLPEEYITCISDYQNNNLGSYDFIICLHCGIKLKSSKQNLHMSECSRGTAVFYQPRSNVLKVSTSIDFNASIEHHNFTIEIFAPYLTPHGEAKRLKTLGNATLNHMRYDYLNKLWLNQGLYGFVTRSIFNVRDQVGRQFGQNFPTNVAESDDDQDDLEYV